MPFLHQIELTVDPDSVERWLPAAKINLAVLARCEGLWSARLYRERRDVPTFLSVAVWRSQDDLEFAAKTLEVQQVTDAVRNGLAASPMTRTFQLIDHVWGRKGFPNFLHPDHGFAQHVLIHVPPSKLDDWTPYRRNCASVIARQTGVASYEIAQDLVDSSVFLILRSYENESFAQTMPGGTTTYRPNKEIEYVLRPATDLDLYQGAQPAIFTGCDLIDGASGPNAASSYSAFMENLTPV